LSEDQTVVRYKNERDFSSGFKARRSFLVQLVDNGTIDPNAVAWQRARCATVQVAGVQVSKDAAFVDAEVFSAHFRTPIDALRDVKSTGLQGSDGNDANGVLMNLQSAIANNIPHEKATVFFRTEQLLDDTALQPFEALHGRQAHETFNFIRKDALQRRPGPMRKNEFAKLPLYDEIALKVTQFQEQLKAEEAAAAAAAAAMGASPEGAGPAASQHAIDGSMVRGGSRLQAALGQSTGPPPPPRGRGVVRRLDGEAAPPKTKARGAYRGSTGAVSARGSSSGAGAASTSAGSAVLDLKGAKAGAREIAVTMQQIWDGYQAGRELNGAPQANSLLCVCLSYSRERFSHCFLHTFSVHFSYYLSQYLFFVFFALL
jgi:hypothetical protein